MHKVVVCNDASGRTHRARRERVSVRELDSRCAMLILDAQTP